MSSFHVFIDGIRYCSLPSSIVNSIVIGNFYFLNRYQSHNRKTIAKFSLVSLIPQWIPFSAFWNAQSPVILLATFSFGVSLWVGVCIEQGGFFLASTFHERNLIWSVARNDLLDCDTIPSSVDLGFIGSGATESDIGPGATFSCSSSLISSENPRSLLSSTDSWGIPGIPGIFGIPKNEIWLGNHLKSHSYSCGIQMGMNSHEIIPGISGTEWVWEYCHFYHNFGKGMSLGILGMSHK